MKMTHSTINRRSRWARGERTRQDDSCHQTQGQTNQTAEHKHRDSLFWKVKTVQHLMCQRFRQLSKSFRLN